MFAKWIKYSTALIFAVSAQVALAKPVVNIQHWTLPQGAGVYFVEAHEQPMLDIAVMFNGGSARDGDLSGTSLMTSSMLDEGTKQYSAEQIASTFDAVGAIYQANSVRDFSWVQLRTLSQPPFIKTAIQTFTDVINQPSFPVENFQRVKNQLLKQLQQNQQEPSTIAINTFYKALYGSTPYASPVEGTITSVENISVDDVKNFYRQYYVAKNANVILVGDLTRNEANDIATELVANLPEGKKASPVNTAILPTSRMNENIRFPSTQTHILMGQVAIKRDSPDYFPLTVGNHILGGGILTSRLNEEIREKQGLAYHVYSNFIAMQDKGPFIIGLSTRKDKATTALSIARKTLKGFMDKGVTANELKEAKQNLVNSFPLGIASNAAVLTNVMRIAAYDLPLNYLDTYRDNIRSVTVKQIKKVFDKIIHPDQLVTITVGQSIF